jgi:hypothetical protein
VREREGGREDADTQLCCCGRSPLHIRSTMAS